MNHATHPVNSTYYILLSQTHASLLGCAARDARRLHLHVTPRAFLIKCAQGVLSEDDARPRALHRSRCSQACQPITATGVLLPLFVHYDSLEPITPSASASSPRRLTTRMKMLIANTHAGKTRINQVVKSLLTSSSNASA